jgi:hypothetical protein
VREAGNGGFDEGSVRDVADVRGWLLNCRKSASVGDGYKKEYVQY